MAVRTMAALLALLALFTASCTSPPPPPLDDASLPLPDGTAGYAAFALCTPRGPCPGVECADNAVGQPDGKYLDLAACTLLDLFTGHEPASGVTLHLGAAITDKLAGGLLVEVSNIGTNYLPGGSLNWLTRENQDPCNPKLSGQRVTFERWCWITNPAYQVRHLRLTTKGLKSGVLLLDAVELMTP